MQIENAYGMQSIYFHELCKASAVLAIVHWHVCPSATHQYCVKAMSKALVLKFLGSTVETLIPNSSP